MLSSLTTGFGATLNGAEDISSKPMLLMVMQFEVSEQPLLLVLITAYVPFCVTKSEVPFAPGKLAPVVQFIH